MVVSGYAGRAVLAERLTVRKIAKSDTQSCTLGVKAHDYVSQTAIMDGRAITIL
jgi:hypothetical protein